MKNFKRLQSRRSGFTLAEVLLAAVLLAIATAGAVLPFSGAATVQAEGIHVTTAAALADNLMQRIANENFDDIVTTYDGYTETAGNITDSAGVVFSDTGYSNYSRTASCQAVHLSQQSGIDDEIFIFATVTVAYKDREMITIKRLIAK